MQLDTNKILFEATEIDSHIHIHRPYYMQYQQFTQRKNLEGGKRWLQSICGKWFEERSENAVISNTKYMENIYITNNKWYIIIFYCNLLHILYTFHVTENKNRHNVNKHDINSIYTILFINLNTNFETCTTSKT